jgi:predicted N-acyltransferase
VTLGGAATALAVSVRTLRSSAELRAAGWDGLLETGGLYSSSEWLAVLEQYVREPRLHVVARDGERLVGGMTCLLLDAESNPSPFTRVDQILARRLELADAARSADLSGLLPTLLCGGREASRSLLLLDPTLPPAFRDSVADEVVGEAERQARALGAGSLSLVCVDPDDDVLCSALSRAGFAGFVNDELAVLDVVWDSFNAYLAALPGRKRGTFRAECRRLSKGGVELTVEPLTPSLVRELVPLELAHCAKYGEPRSAEQSERSLLLLANARLPVYVSLARRGGELRGFVVFLRWRDELYARQAGFDDARRGKLPIYFGTLFYEPIAFATRAGVRRIEYAFGSSQAKALRGCRTTPHYAYVKCLRPEPAGSLTAALAEVAS